MKVFVAPQGSTDPQERLSADATIVAGFIPQVDITGLTPTTAYEAVVVGYNSPTDSVQSNPTAFTTKGLHPRMTGLRVDSVMAQSATMLWDAVANASSYTLEVYALPIGVNEQPIKRLSFNHPKTRERISGLQPNTQYEVQMRYFFTAAAPRPDGLCDVDVATFQFSTEQRLNPPTNVRIGDLTVVGQLGCSPLVGTHFPVSWNAVPEALAYIVTANPTIGNASQFTDTVTTTSANVSGLTDNTCYNVSINAIRFAIEPGGGTHATVILRTFDPTIVPINIRTTTLSPQAAKLTWSAFPGSKYRVRLSQGGTLIKAETARFNEIELTGLQHSTAYTVSIQTDSLFRTDGTFASSPFSPPFQFTTPAPPPPDLSQLRTDLKPITLPKIACNAPTNVDATVSKTAVTVRWGAPIGAQSYEILVRPVGTTSFTTFTSTTNSVSLSFGRALLGTARLKSGTNYECKVRTVCAAGESAFSALEKFTTP